ncbi:hypothetical protein [Streptococcus loxodontisalivarius]|uniref:Uncharacterized protein n=1 Tax=Streptococcus loxodontisalivarius TaxID=1349415 RepID=A0ABS2PST2_9STRE|nr:hypothetical protein [Streptococcus loxodontisalivarius]MBM7642986.1 hypothetical protein [Streptococcus loxodontisalivarius]
MKKSLIIGTLSLAAITAGYLTYQSGWGQEHLADSKLGNGIVQAYQKTEDFATSKADQVLDYFTK